MYNTLTTISAASSATIVLSPNLDWLCLCEISRQLDIPKWSTRSPAIGYRRMRWQHVGAWIQRRQVWTQSSIDRSDSVRSNRRRILHEVNRHTYSHNCSMVNWRPFVGSYGDGTSWEKPIGRCYWSSAIHMRLAGVGQKGYALLWHTGIGFLVLLSASPSMVGLESSCSPLHEKDS